MLVIATAVLAEALAVFSDGEEASLQALMERALLTGDRFVFLEAYEALSEDDQQMFRRRFSTWVIDAKSLDETEHRVGVWHRLFNLNYPGACCSSGTRRVKMVSAAGILDSGTLQQINEALAKVGDVPQENELFFDEDEFNIHADLTPLPPQDTMVVDVLANDDEFVLLEIFVEKEELDDPIVYKTWRVPLSDIDWVTCHARIVERLNKALNLEADMADDPGDMP